MKKNVLNSVQYITRLFLLVGVLTGIFFSSGEGVSLLPFPVSAADPEKQSVAQTRHGKSYSLSVHNSASPHSGNSKAQRQLKSEIACVFFYRSESQYKDFFYSASVQSRKQSKVFYSFKFFYSLSDRAPPAA